MSSARDSRPMTRATDQTEPDNKRRVSERIRLRPSRSRSPKDVRENSPDVWRHDKAKEAAKPLRRSEERRRAASLERQRQNRQRKDSTSSTPRRVKNGKHNRRSSSRKKRRSRE